MTNEAKLQNTVSAKKAPQKRKRIVSLDRKKARAGWFFVLPFIIGFFLIYLPIIFKSLQMSVSSMEYLEGGGYLLHFTGIANYRNALLVDPNFVKLLVTGLEGLILDIPSIVLFALFIALLLNQNIAGRAAFRAIFFIPVIVATGLIKQIEALNAMEEFMEAGTGTNMNATLDAETSSGSSGGFQLVSMFDIYNLLGNMAVGSGIVEYVIGLVNNIFNIVNRCGVQMLIFLSGLQSVSPAIYESCSIDGASGWETFWKVTLPMVSPMILVNVIYTLIDSFTTSNTVMTYIDSISTSAGGVTRAAAMSWIYFLVVLLFIGIVAFILRFFVFYQRKD